MKRSLFSLVLVLILCAGLLGCAAEPVIDSREPSVESTATTVAETTEETVEETTAESTEAATETVHTHSFADATCTKPKTCSACGETEGKAAGHDWDAATCESPKTCSVCSKTSGSAAAHDYEDGECTWCGKGKPSSSGSEMVWIPTKGGKKYHKKETCSNMDGPEKVTKEEAEKQGFEPCKRCYK